MGACVTCCTRCCIGFVVLTLLGAAALVAYPVSRKGLIYYKDLFGHIGGGVKFHLERDVGGFGVSNVQSFEYAFWTVTFLGVLTNP